MVPYYADESSSIYLGDCLEVMQELEPGSVDLAVTSPPYNLGGAGSSGFAKPGQATGKWSGGKLATGYGEHSDDMPHDEYVAWQHDVVEEVWNLLSPTGALFYNHKTRIQNGVLSHPLELIPSSVPVRQILTWDRGSGMNTSQGASFFTPQTELIIVAAKEDFKLRPEALKLGDVWRFPFDVGSDHPAPFPLGLPMRIIGATDAKTVLDPFLGSGTTLRAAKDLGRCGVGIELEPAFAEMSKKRLAQEVLF